MNSDKNAALVQFSFWKLYNRIVMLIYLYNFLYLLLVEGSC